MEVFEAIYRRCFPKVFGFLLRLCGDRALAEELTAETFYRAYLCLDRFEGRSSIDTWLCEIAKHCWQEELRKRKRHVPLTGAQDESPPLWLSVEEKETSIRLHQALRLLPEPYQEVFRLKILGELKFCEIAQIFGKTESWAKMTFYRGKNKLLAMLEEEEK